MSPPKVAAIVLNYNGRDLTLQTVESLLDMSYPGLGVIVVDNGSTDDSHEAVQRAFPQITALRVEENRGIAFGLNAGIVHALERGDDYLLLLNNDIEVDPEMLTELVAVAESDPTIGCVGPKAYYHADRGRLWSAGGIIRFKESVTRERGMGEIDRGQYDRTEEVDYINGCAMLVPRQAMAKTGLWDPVYYIGVEDADWCMRMKALGYRCVYAHRARLWHMVSPTTGGYKPGRNFETGRGSAIFVRRYGRLFDRLTFVAFLGAAMPLAWLRELFKGNQAAVVAKVRGLIAGFKLSLPEPPPAPGSRHAAQGAP